MTITDNMEIRELHDYNHSQFEDLKQLMSELSDRVNFTQTDLMLVLKDSKCHLYVILDGKRIIGCATLCVFHSPTGTKASIEDVVVSSAYRGQHLGRQLMEYVLEQAKAYAPIELHLTSKPKRVAANHLYQSLGFQKKETNCYRMTITECSSESLNNNSLKQSINYRIGKERVKVNVEPLTAEYISRVLKVDVDEVETAMREMEIS